MAYVTKRPHPALGLWDPRRPNQAVPEPKNPNMPYTPGALSWLMAPPVKPTMQVKATAKPPVYILGIGWVWVDNQGNRHVKPAPMPIREGLGNWGDAAYQSQEYAAQLIQQAKLQQQRGWTSSSVSGRPIVSSILTFMGGAQLRNWRALEAAAKANQAVVKEYIRKEAVVFAMVTVAGVVWAVPLFDALNLKLVDTGNPALVQLVMNARDGAKVSAEREQAARAKAEADAGDAAFQKQMGDKYNLSALISDEASSLIDKAAAAANTTTDVIKTVLALAIAAVGFGVYSAIKSNRARDAAADRVLDTIRGRP